MSAESAPFSSTSRLEAFSDGVLAIIVTIMVLEIHTPEEATFDSLRHLSPILLSYILSFVFVGIYWNNHHHLLRATRTISSGVMWANLHLLFWLSLIPFGTAWIGDDHTEALPAATYGVIVTMAGLAYALLVWAILSCNRESEIATAIGSDVKGKVSIAISAVGIPLAFISPWLAYAMFVLLAAIWLIPDKRLDHL